MNKHLKQLEEYELFESQKKMLEWALDELEISEFIRETINITLKRGTYNDTSKNILNLIHKLHREHKNK